jgi:hypothetical protein
LGSDFDAIHQIGHQGCIFQGFVIFSMCVKASLGKNFMIYIMLYAPGC